MGGNRGGGVRGGIGASLDPRPGSRAGSWKVGGQAVEVEIGAVEGLDLGQMGQMSVLPICWSPLQRRSESGRASKPLGICRAIPSFWSRREPGSGLALLVGHWPADVGLCCVGNCVDSSFVEGRKRG